jgi:hypothetical protein
MSVGVNLCLSGFICGFLDRRGSPAIQVERGLRCVAMSVIIVLISVFIASSILQLLFEAFLRKCPKRLMPQSQQLPLHMCF